MYYNSYKWSTTEMTLISELWYPARGEMWPKRTVGSSPAPAQWADLWLWVPATVSLRSPQSWHLPFPRLFFPLYFKKLQKQISQYKKRNKEIET